MKTAKSPLQVKKQMRKQDSDDEEDDDEDSVSFFSLDKPESRVSEETISGDSEGTLECNVVSIGIEPYQITLTGWTHSLISGRQNESLLIFHFTNSELFIRWATVDRLAQLS